MEQDDVSAKSEYAESIAAKSGVTEEPSESEGKLEMMVAVLNLLVIVYFSPL